MEGKIRVLHSYWAAFNAPCVRPTRTTIYRLHIIDEADNLIETDEVKVTVLDTIMIQLSTTEAIICSGVAATLTAVTRNRYATYLWSTGETTKTIEVQAAGTYSATVTNASGCQSTASIEIRDAADIEIAIQPDPAILCLGQTLTLSAPEGFSSYQWGTADGNIQAGATNAAVLVDQAGTYTATVTHQNGCTTSTDIEVVSGDNPAAIQQKLADEVFHEEPYTVQSCKIDHRNRMTGPALVLQLEDRLHLCQMAHGDVKKPLVAMWIFAALFSFLFLPSLPARLAAQSPAGGFTKIPIEVNGIPFNQFVAIVQDSEGFLWLSTGEELLKYDGYEAKVYRNNPKDPTSLDHNNVRTLYVDAQGALWAGHEKGLSRYKKKCECFANYPLTSPSKSAEIDSIFQKTVFEITQTTVSAITEDRSQRLWAATMGGDLLRYDRKSDTFLPFPLLNDPQKPHSMLPPFINVLLADRHNNLWIGAGLMLEVNRGSLIRFNLDTKEIKRFVHDPDDNNSLLDSRVTTILEDQQGRIMVGTFKGGLHYYHPEAENFSRLLFNPAQPNALHAPSATEKRNGDYPGVVILHQDRKGGLWVGTYGVGLYHFDAQTGKLAVYAYDRGPPNAFVNNNFLRLFEDRQGQIWLGTLQSGGLYKMDTYVKKFIWYPALKRAQRSCESKTEPGVLWISSMGEGLRRLDSKTGVIKTYLHDKNNPNSIGHNQVRAVHEDDDGILWIGLGDGGYGGFESGKGGLDRFDPKTGIFQHYTFRNEDKPDFNWSVYAIHEDEQGRLWFDTGPGGLFRSDRRKKNFEPYVIAGTEGSELWLAPANHRKALWVTDFTKKIMYRFDAGKDQFTSIIKGDAAESVLEDESGYWIASWDQGLLHFDPATGITQRYTEEDGLSSNSAVDILSTRANIYWVATRKGITKFDARTKTFHNDGMPRGHFHPTHLKSKDGQLFFGADEGVVAFYPAEVEGNPIPPELAFKHLQIAGETFPLEKNEAGEFEKLQLTSRQNDFNIAYVGLHFGNPGRNKYQYKLTPFDKDWIDAGTQRSVQYTNLEPGEYTFELKAANSDGIWTEEALTLSFKIHIAWWKSWWFYTFSIALIAGISYWFYHFQLSRTLAVQQSKRLQEINQLKTNLYNNITHEFRTPLTVILGMTENLKSETIAQQLEQLLRPLEMIERNSQNLLHLVNEMLDLAKIESGNLELKLQQADVIPFIKYLTESFHSLATEKHINLAVQAAEQTLVMDFDADKLAVIVSNLLSNAIKFTSEGGEVAVRLEAEPAHVIIGVKDNGIGIATEEIPFVFDRFYQADHSSVRRYQGTGIGLALTKELVTLMQGTIQVESEPGRGSEFIVRLPVHREALKAESPAMVIPLRPGISPADSYLDEDPSSGEVNLPLVLIIEDHVDVAQYIGTCLHGKYQYVQAADGRAGIETAFEKIPDLIICDVMMPEKDGFEVCATLKADERTNHIPIILLTARVTIEDRLAGLAKGADAYLAKPFAKEELLIRLHQLFELRKTLQKKYSEQLFILPSSDTIVVEEDPFLVKARAIVLAELEDDTFSLNELSAKLYLSRSQVHRKIKAVTGMSTAIFIRTIRLQEAKKLLASTQLSISEIAYEVGFKSPIYFSQMFKETFGESPSDFRK
ncbi:MAG TPA: two-component regulator propeller domain-containing protein [Saprospiraceae bacterium]|nr:two-component regulator propeller domain-containing protein [Saprospiraceae bacterium]